METDTVKRLPKPEEPDGGDELYTDHGPRGGTREKGKGVATENNADEDGSRRIAGTRTMRSRVMLRKSIIEDIQIAKKQQCRACSKRRQGRCGFRDAKFPCT